MVIKLAAYDLLADISHSGCDAGCSRSIGVTATTRYVAVDQLRRRASNSSAAIARLDQYLASAAVLEPNEAELRLAAKFENAGSRSGVALDTGESQLAAIAITRTVPGVVTGDKRAIAAAESLLAGVPELGDLARRVACMEQVMTLVVKRLGARAVRTRVLAEARVDKAISICFQVTMPSVPNTFEPTGLTSYINSVRVSAPTLLMPGECLVVPSVP